MRSAGLLLVAACGRFGFDGVTHDDAVAGDARDGGDAPEIDAPACTAVTSNDWLATTMPRDANKQLAVSADGTYVIDQNTGLMWQRSPAPSLLDIPSAMAYCASLSLGGCTHWRLPQRIELGTLVDHRQAAPVIDPTAFPGTPTDNPFATATPNTAANNTWLVNFDNGNTFWNANTVASYVRCVAGGAVGPVPPARYTVTPMTALDTATGLMWPRSNDITLYTQAQAVAHCTTSGMRLPEIEELATLIDTTKSSPAIDTTTFPGAPSVQYWSVSPYGSSAYLVIDFTSGNTINAPPTDTYVVRCVQ